MSRHYSRSQLDSPTFEAKRSDPRWPATESFSCAWCGLPEAIESRIGRHDLHESCVDPFCRETYPEDYCVVCEQEFKDCNCPEVA